MFTTEKINEAMKNANDKFIRESILTYGCKLKEIKIKSIVKNEFTITIGYGILEKNFELSILRVTVYNFNTLDRIYFEGNVYDTKFCENLTFEKVLSDCKKTLCYQLKKINEII